MNEYQTFQAGPKKGQPKTLTDRVIRFLVEGLNMQETTSRSKYRQFTKEDRNYFIGKAGAVRAGKSASDSVSLTDIVHNNMRLWERKQNKEKQDGTK